MSSHAAPSAPQSAPAPAPAPAPTSSSSSSSAIKPPVTLGQTTHLDPGAYVRGTHGITLGDQTLVHPRAQLVATHGPLFVGDKCIISEKCVIGGPPSATSEHNTALNPSSSPLHDNDSDPVKTTIYSHVYVHANAHIHAGATVKEGAVIEPHVTVLTGVTIGAHSKICAGVTVAQDVADWTVAFGNGELRRKRPRENAKTETDTDLVEALRLKAMDKEREGTGAILKVAARTATLAKKK